MGIAEDLGGNHTEPGTLMYMSEKESIVQSPRKLFQEAVLAENSDALAKFMDQPLTAIAETITGALAAGPKSWTVMTGRIVQAVLKGKTFQQVGREIEELREKGKIPDDFADEKHKYGFKSWVELLTVIDEETPDVDRLEALKAMFFAVNTVNATDGEKIVAYQLFQIAKRLTSGQLLYLKACYDIYRAGEYTNNQQSTPAEYWMRKVSTKLGHEVLALLDKDDLVLVGEGLMTPRLHDDRSGIREDDAHLSKLGILFCENIQKYQTAVSDDKE